MTRESQIVEEPTESFEHSGIGTIHIGDRFRVMITGMIGQYTAEVVEFDNYRGGRPILQVYEGDTVMEPLLKGDDYILQERIEL